MTPAPAPSFPTLVQDFFCQRLMAQGNASPRTVISYRDTFRLLLRYCEEKTGTSAALLTLGHLTASLILGFLDHLEKTRGNSVRSRNARLAAIRSFFHYAAHRDPISLPLIGQVLAIPMKRFDRPLLDFLSREEVEAVLRAPDPCTWSGCRDQVMLATLYNTGARVSEIVGLRVMDAQIDGHASLRIRGKGRKQREVPLWRSTLARLKAWVARNDGRPEAPLFPNRDGMPLSRFGVVKRLRAAARVAAEQCPALRDRHISPHTLRHTTAMHLLQSGVDITVIALWLGHESPATTHLYVEADLSMKQRALDRLPAPPGGRPRRFRPSDRLLAFLEAL